MPAWFCQYVLLCYVPVLNNRLLREHNNFFARMHRVCVLGDSLSAKGKCLRLKQGWPYKLQERLGGDWQVSVCAQGGLMASITDMDGKYYGFSKQLGRAQNTDAEHFVICLGTNDVTKEGGVTQADIEAGLQRIVTLVYSGVQALFNRKPTVYLLPPPNIFAGEPRRGSASGPRAKADGPCPGERRRRRMMPAALQAVARRTNARLMDSVRLEKHMKHDDGVHLKDAGTSVIADMVYKHLTQRQRITTVLKQVRCTRTSRMTPVRKRRAFDAARTMGKQAFFAMTRSDLRTWAATYVVPFSGGKLKVDEQRAILSKIESKWLF